MHPQLNKQPHLVIFDFDGTLADTTATILLNYRMAIGELGLESRSDAACQATIGLPLKEGFRQLYPSLPESDLENCVTTYRRIFNEHKLQMVPRLFPGVKDTLGRLSELGIRMSVASSRSRESLVEFCHLCGIDRYFDLILGANDVSRAKPDPEPVLVTLRKLGHRPQSTIVVGDMPVDIAMGRGAGCITVGVTFGNSTPQQLTDAGADHIISSFGELTDIASDRFQP